MCHTMFVDGSTLGPPQYSTNIAQQIQIDQASDHVSVVRSSITCALPPSCNAHHRHCTGSWGLLGQPSTKESTAARNKDTEQIVAAVSTVLITQLSCGDSKRILPVTMQQICRAHVGVWSRDEERRQSMWRQALWRQALTTCTTTHPWLLAATHHSAA
jgi:hypothetical protein